MVSKIMKYSKLDPKNAYHQVPLLKVDHSYIAFEDVGKLYNFKKDSI